MTLGPRAYTWTGVAIAIAAAVAAVAAAFTVDSGDRQAQVPAPSHRSSGVRSTGFGAATPPAVTIVLKGCGATYMGPLVVNQKLRIVNGGTVVRHQIYTGAGAIVPIIAASSNAKRNWLIWSANGAGVFTLKFTHKGCATPEKVIATVK